MQTQRAGNTAVGLAPVTREGQPQETVAARPAAANPPASPKGRRSRRLDVKVDPKDPDLQHPRVHADRPTATERRSLAAGETRQALRCLVIVPAFNERQSVGEVVRRLRRALPDFDVLVIDDGSTDDTVRQVPPETAVVSLPFNLGIGGAMQTGYRYAAIHGYDVAVQVDGDGQHRPREVAKLVRRLQEGQVDFVLGSRFLGNTTYRQSFTRMAGIWMLRQLLRLLTGRNITDCTSGFRAANQKVIRAFAHWYPEDYPEPEVILLLHRAGFRIEEMPVRMSQRRNGQSSINFFVGVFYVMKVTICLLLDMAREPWPSGKVGM